MNILFNSASAGSDVLNACMDNLSPKIIRKSMTNKIKWLKNTTNHFQIRLPGIYNYIRVILSGFICCFYKFSTIWI